MSIMDEFETGSVEGLQPIAMRDPNALKFSPQDLVILATWVTSPAYKVPPGNSSNGYGRLLRSRVEDGVGAGLVTL